MGRPRYGHQSVEAVAWSKAPQSKMQRTEKPYRRLLLLFPPIPMPAWLFVSLYALLELVLGVTGTQSGVAHFAHLGGMLGGYLVLRLWRRRTP